MTWRRTVTFLAAGVLLAGCTGSSSSDGDAVAAPSGGEPSAATAATAATAASTAAPATTTPPATTQAATTTTSPPASITPFVVCVDYVNGPGDIVFGDDGFYFGYETTGSEPVVVLPGPDNALNDSLATDHPNVPSVFAPGRVELAFLAISGSGPSLPSWTVRGPDGEVRTATGDPNAPECTPELIGSLSDDDRSLEVDYAYRTLPDGAPTAQALEVSATVTGLPELSVCPAGLDPRPVLVEIDLGTNRSTGTTGRAVFEVTTITRPDFVTLPGVPLHRSVRVTDRCAAGEGPDAAVTESWPLSTSLEGWAIGQVVCIEVSGTSAIEGECIRLPLTGGVRTTR